jgi:hypothetical protein
VVVVEQAHIVLVVAEQVAELVELHISVQVILYLEVLEEILDLLEVMVVGCH